MGVCVWGGGDKKNLLLVYMYVCVFMPAQKIWILAVFTFMSFRLNIVIFPDYFIWKLLYIAGALYAGLLWMEGWEVTIS